MYISGMLKHTTCINVSTLHKHLDLYGNAEVIRHSYVKQSCYKQNLKESL